ncbi:MAG: type II toxin-antitoxin system prevent-host-death family antitoxin [Verrucomicrobiota bacterium]
MDELLDEAVHGESVAIAVDDNVVVRWTVERKAPRSQSAEAGWPMMGMYKGQGWMAPDFNEIPEGFEEYVK